MPKTKTKGRGDIGSICCFVGMLTSTLAFVYHCVYVKSGCYEGRVFVLVGTCVRFDPWR